MYILTVLSINGKHWMNIFITNLDPIKSADDHCKRHRNKMIVEYAQLLSSAHHVLGGDIDGIYKKTHVNHPSAVWTRSAREHYVWVWRCAMQLCVNYTRDTGKVHKTESVLQLLSTPPVSIRDVAFRNPPVAAPDEFKALAVFGDVCNAYQKYLISKFNEWQQRDKPLNVEFDHVPNWYTFN